MTKDTDRKAMAKRLEDAKFEVASNEDELQACDVVVCMAVADGQPLILPDNIIDFCAECDTKIQVSVTSPVGPKRVCYQCALEGMPKNEEVKVIVSPAQIEQLRKALKLDQN